MKSLLGKKIGMSQIFREEGTVVPVTWIEAGSCFITQIKEENKDGYKAIQIGFEEKKKNTKKSEKGKKYRHLKEFRGLEKGEFKTGDEINLSIFNEGDIVKVSGTSKAKGWQGVVKRWGFAGDSKTHGTKHTLRKGGSIGSTNAGRVFKGKKMAGRMGGRKNTVKNLKIVKIEKDKKLIALRGAVPGRRGTLIEIRG